MPFGCGGKPAVNENRMNRELSDFAVRLRGIISSLVAAEVTRLKNSESLGEISTPLGTEPPYVGSYKYFDSLALELFALQFKYNSAYQKVCRERRVTPELVEHWTQIPAVPTAAFKELDLSCLAPGERTSVFHSSGTTEQRPSRHYHCRESLRIYEASLLSWFVHNVLSDLRFTTYDLRLICLTPPPELAPHSSLVHMFETVRQKIGGARVPASRNEFLGRTAPDGSWTLDFDTVLAALNSSLVTRPSTLLLGTAFSFVHLLDFLAEKHLRFKLPTGSRVMETGGYKNRSRSMPKAELYELITERLGVPPENIICEYGMSELSSQAYDCVAIGSVVPHPGPLPKERENSSQSVGKTTVPGNFKERPLLFPLPPEEGQGEGKRGIHPPSSILYPRFFRFPPWARVQIILPETGREVADEETGLIRVFDLANVFSVMAIQTEDLGVRREDGFELIGRARLAEPRGCSLMNA